MAQIGDLLEVVHVTLHETVRAHSVKVETPHIDGSVVQAAGAISASVPQKALDTHRAAARG